MPNMKINLICCWRHNPVDFSSDRNHSQVCLFDGNIRNWQPPRRNKKRKAFWSHTIICYHDWVQSGFSTTKIIHILLYNFEYTDPCVSQTCMCAWMRHWQSWHICSPWACKDLRVQLHTTRITQAKVFAALRGLHLHLRQKIFDSSEQKVSMYSESLHIGMRKQIPSVGPSFPLLLYCQNEELIKTAKLNN